LKNKNLTAFREADLACSYFHFMLLHFTKRSLMCRNFFARATIFADRQHWKCTISKREIRITCSSDECRMVKFCGFRAQWTRTILDDHILVDGLKKTRSEYKVKAMRLFLCGDRVCRTRILHSIC